ncbi:MAG TPA: ComEC/Rec2 family competence protein [Acetobacteraceae bacterium]|nr:ComEC/Rec2 family competence protein [Acetobacteraceae bacterium]
MLQAVGLWRVLAAQWNGVAHRLAISRIGHLVTTLAEAERGRFALWLPVFMATGVLLYYQLRVEPPDWIGAKFAAGAFAAALAVPNRQVLRAIGFSVGFAALGFASAQYATLRLPPIEADLPAKAVLATGTVRSVEILSYARRMTLSGVTLSDGDRPPAAKSRRRQTQAQYDPQPQDADHIRLVRQVRIRLATGDNAPIETGDTVRVRAMARPPLPPALPGGWDTQRDAFFAGLGASGYALAPVEIIAHGAPHGLASRVQSLRETIAARITAAIPGAAGEVSITLLTGASRGIPEADHAAFRASGLAHLLAVAGLHIGIVMAFALGAARTMLALSERASLFWPAKQLAVVFALCVAGGYMVLTGAHVPIVRSFAMACLLTLAILAGRQPISVRGLGLAGIALMLIAPYEVPGVSFQMSFSAVLALISGYETLRPWLRRLYGKSLAKRLLSYGIALALTSTLAGTASMPYGAYHFGHVQIYYILSNVVAVPVTALWVMPAGLIALLLMPFGLDWIALIPMGWGAGLLIDIARFTAALPNATVGVPHMPEWGLIVLSIGLAWLGLWRSWIRLLGIGAIIAGIASPAFDRPPDIFLSSDAGLIGFRTEHGVFLQQTRSGSDFTRDAWLTRWDVAAAVPLPGEGTAAAGALSCEPDACLFQPRDGVMPALLVRGPAKPTGCKAASVVVSAEPARSVCAWPSPRPVDRFTVWRDGAVAIWLEPHGARVLTDREYRGARPWVIPPPKPRARPVSNLPIAPLDR